MNSIKSYPKYKPTSIDWIGDIPEHWEFVRIWRLFGERNILNKKKLNLPLLTVSINTGVGFFDGSDKVNVKAEDESTYQVCKQADIVYNKMRMWQGAVGVAPCDGLISPAYQVLIPKPDVNSLYYNYLLRTDIYKLKAFQNSYGIALDRNRLYWEKFKDVMFTLPPKEEQDTIVSFLNHKCQLIDKFLDKKQQLINTLKEQKQAVIYQAVTKGINADVEMKDSGVEWLGKIPAHWEVKKLKFVTKFISRGTTPNYVENSPYKVVNQATFSKGYFDESSIRFHGANKITNSKGQLQQFDILLASTGGGVLGKSFFFELKGQNYISDSHVTIIRTNHSLISPKFLYLFFSINFGLIEGYLGQGSTNQTELQRHWLAGLLVTFPDFNEQQEILSFIEKETTQIDQAISRIEKEMELTKDYRQILISEAVTGKIDVRNLRQEDLHNQNVLSIAAEPIPTYKS